DIFNGSKFVVEYDEVTNLKRAVEEYYEVVKKVAKNILRSESNGNTTDTQACDYCTDIITKIVKKENNSDDPYNDIQDQHDSTQLFHLFFSAFLSADIRLK